MDYLSFTFLEKFQYVQITYSWESYVVWLLHETDGHFVAEQLSASPDDYGESGCLEASSLVFPCCSAAPVDVDGERVFRHGCLKSRSISPPGNPAPSVCCPNERSPFSSSWPPSSTCYASAQPNPHSAPVTGPLSTSRVPESSSESVNVTMPLMREQKKRHPPNTSCQKARGKKKKLTTSQAASRLLTQLYTPIKRGSYEHNILPGDANTTKKLSEFKQLVNSAPAEVDKFVGQMQAWLQQLQQQSTLHLAALQHLLACVDLYNWANRNDNRIERNYDKRRWSEVQMARYRNMLANELCKTKGGKRDRLGLTTLVLMTAKGLKFGHLQNAVGKDKAEIIQQFATLTRPILEKELENLEVVEATNPVGFVCWFLGKPVGELSDICEALCFSELSIEDCYPSPSIWHQIRTCSTLDMYTGGGSHSDGSSQGLEWLLQTAERGEERDEETSQGGMHEAPTTNQTQPDNIIRDLSDVFVPETLHLGFS